MKIVILGLSITSSWGNGHATNYRALARALDARGHEVLFLERDVPWYAPHRDLPHPPYAATRLYDSVDELMERYGGDIRAADLVLLGSYVPEGAEIARLILGEGPEVVAFYDIDTPVTLAALAAGTCEYMAADIIPRLDLYLSFTGGPALDHLQDHYGARRARPFYCLVDSELYRPAAGGRAAEFAVGFLGTFDEHRQRALERLLLEPAASLPHESFVVAGPQYPAAIQWPANVRRIEHVPPSEHRDFYASQRLTLNLTRRDMIEWGWSPSVRLFEAAACGVPIISDWWSGLDSFFEPESEILIASSGRDVVEIVTGRDGAELAAIASRARARVIREHTAPRRAAELESLVAECAGATAR
jgi:spore maturation protein CgeB